MDFLIPSSDFLLLFISLFVLLSIALLIWALLDLLKSNFTENNLKIIWALVILLVPFLGPILYFFIGRKQKSNYVTNA